MPPTGNETLRMLATTLDATPDQFKNGDHAYFVAEGLEVGHRYRLYHSQGGLNPDIDHGQLSQIANANGRATAALELSNQTNLEFWLHYTTAGNSSQGDRVGNAVTITWASGNAEVEYGVPPVLTNCDPGNTIISLNWDAAQQTADALASGIEYQVRRSTTLGGTYSNFSGSSNLTVLGFVNTGLTNGSERFYKVRPTFFYVDDLIEITQHEDGSFYDSNILSAIPYLAGEFWGQIGVTR